MPFALEIRFGRSASKSYPDALRLLKRFSNIVTSTSDRQYNSVSVSEDELIRKRRKVTELWGLVSNWKGSRFMINGKLAEFADLNAFSTVFDCFDKYKTAVIQEEHCNTHDSKRGWGCRWLQEVNPNLPDSSWSGWRYWYQFGHFSAITIWKVDKEKLRLILRREIDIKKVSLCPVFNVKNIWDILDGLPDQIDISTDAGWQVLFEESPDGTTSEKQPVGIQRVFKSRDVLSITLDGFGSKPAKPETNEQSESRYIPDITFTNIGGIDDIIETIREIIELPIKKPEILKYLGIIPHKGILLHGMPGCGKTLIAKAIANEIQAHFISIRGPELLSKWHGQSEENLRSIFEEAKRLQPSIIYFDEIDSIAQVRSGEEFLRFDARFVNQLLTLMDGVEDYGNLRVLASTNRIELLDNALLRHGRFDFTIEIKKPTLEGCNQILSIQTKDMPVESGFDKKEFSKRLFGYTGADIAFVARESAYNCLRRNVDLKSVIANSGLDNIEYRSFIVKNEDFEMALNTLKYNAVESTKDD